MIENCTFAIIGPGVMGRTIAYSLINAGVSPERLTLAGPNSDRLAELAQELSVGTTLDNAEAAQSADVVILAVKPQRLNQAARVIRPALKETALVISIIAGISTAALSQQLGTNCIVRAMPNTPARIGMGITVWTRTPQVDEAQKETAAEVFRSMGEEVFVEDEVYLDMATALSGTGPAYVFLFMEAMIDAGVHMGFPRRIAEQLVLETATRQHRVLRPPPRTPRRPAQRRHFTRRHFCRSAVLPRKSRLPHRHFARHLGCLPALHGTRFRKVQAKPGRLNKHTHH